VRFATSAGTWLDGATLRAMRDWWLRTLLVLQRPRPVFVALRDTDSESLGDRSEPVLAIVILAGIAVVLSTSTANHLLDDNDYDGLLVAVWAFIAGGIYGAFVYWIVGGLLHIGAKVLGSQGTYRRSRQVLAFAAVPIVLTLVAWPVKLALYGEDVFRSGGHDAGGGAHVFTGLLLAATAWSAVLLVIGVRSVHGWTWARSLGACALAALGVLAIVVSSL
jgi:hypothetical protein